MALFRTNVLTVVKMVLFVFRLIRDGGVGLVKIQATNLVHNLQDGYSRLDIIIRTDIPG